MPKKISDEVMRDLKFWLQELEVSYKNLHRDFSDALPVANILKKIFPKIIDLHNYPSRNNTQLKLNNWETLNQKVLVKINLPQTKTMLEKFAKGVPGAVETLLVEIMQMDRAQKSKGDQRDDEQEQLWAENDDVMMVTVNKKIGDALVQVPQKMILYSIYEQIHQDSLSKDNYITAAQQKITHLENVINLKTERIEELSAQLAKVSVRSLLKQQNLDTNLSGSSLSEHNANAANATHIPIRVNTVQNQTPAATPADTPPAESQ